MAGNSGLRVGQAAAAREEIRRRLAAHEEAADLVTELGRLAAQQKTYAVQQALDRWDLRLTRTATATVSLIDRGEGNRQ